MKPAYNLLINSPFDVSLYSTTPVTRTLKGNEKHFEFLGNLSYLSSSYPGSNVVMKSFLCSWKVIFVRFEVFVSALSPSFSTFKLRKKTLIYPRHYL